jgi:hypothetical protein
MRTFLMIVVLALLTPVFSDAQTHSASQAAIEQALQEGSASRADRERVLRLLERTDVAAIAQNAGIDLQRAQAAVATFTDAELASIAKQAKAVEEALVGGQSVTISTTFLIIALLLVIILILAVK